MLAHQTFTLTTGVDTTLVGGAGDDTYNGTQATLTAGDRLDGKGGNDTLSITSTGSLTLGTGVVSTGVETISVIATGATTVDATQFDGVTAVTNTGSTAASHVAFTGLKAIPAINVNSTNSNTTVGFATGVVSGTADSATVNLTTSASVADVAVTVNGVETINVVANGASGTADVGTTAGRAVTVASDTLTNLTVSGTGSARLVANLVGASATITGNVTSTATGSEDISLTAASTARVNANLGAGNDTLRIGQIAATHTLAGGEGTDTLVPTTSITTTTGANISGFEAVTTGAGVSVALPSTNAVATLNVTGGSATLAGLAAGGTVNLMTASSSATVTNTSGWTGTADVLNVNAGSSSTAGAFAGTVTANGIETVNYVNVAAPGDITARTVTINGDALRTINLTGAQAATLNGGNTTLTKVDASAVQGNLTIGTLARAAAGAEIIGGAGNDTFAGGDGNDTLTGGAGNDSLSGGLGIDVLSGGEGNDTVNGGAGRDTLSGGAGSDLFVIAANTAVTGAGASSVAATPKVITDFATGVDRIELGQLTTAFLGNFANIQLGLAAMTAQNQAFFVQGENTLYVVALQGQLGQLDTVLRLDTVTTLAPADLVTTNVSGGGSDITLTDVNAAVATTGASANAAVTTGFTGSTSTNTTGLSDTVRSTGAFLAGNAAAGGAGATLNGGNGSDTLAVTGGGTLDMSDITNFESVTLGETTVSGGTTTAYALTIVNANIGDGTVLAINGSGTTTTTVLVDGSTVTGNRRLNLTGGEQILGVDTLTGGAGNDTISGGAGNDSITGGAGNDSLVGGNGDDLFVIAAGAGSDTIDGGSGNDTVALTGAIGTSSTDLTAIELGAGVNTVNLGAAANLTNATVTSTGGLYRITVTNNVTDASVTVAQFNGAFEVTGGNTEALTFTTNGSVNLSTTTVESFTLSGGATSTTGANSVTVGAQAVTVNGAGGVDTFTAVAAANHRLIGAGGADVFNMSTFLTSGDTITGGSGTDTLNFTNPAAAAATALDTVTQVETINYTAVEGDGTAANQRTVNTITITDASSFDADATAVTFSATNNFATTLNFGAVDRAVTITAGGGADVITGGAGADSITAAGGADNITAGGGNDVISAGDAADDITGGTGGDTLTGGAGIDRFRFTTADGTIGALDVITDFRAATGDNNSSVDVIELAGVDWLVGTNATIQDLSAQTSLGAALNAAANANAVNNGLSVFTFGGATYFYGEVNGGGTSAQANDFVLRIDGTPFAANTALANLTVGTSTGLVGTFGADTLTGTAAADNISGGEGNDSLSGAADADVISGGAGVDTINGGAGADNLSGGAGADTFVFAESGANNGSDTFTDLTVGTGGDVLNLSAFAIDGNATATAPGALAAVLTANPGASTAIAGTIQRLVNIANGEDITTAAGLATALANGEYANLDMAANSKAIIITSATAGADVDYIFFATSDANGVISVVLVGTTTNNVDIDDYVVGNFLI